MPLVVDAVERTQVIGTILGLLLIIWLLVQHDNLFSTSLDRRIDRRIVPPHIPMLRRLFDAFCKWQILVSEMSFFRKVASMRLFIVVLVCHLFHREEIKSLDSTDIELPRWCSGYVLSIQPEMLSRVFSWLSLIGEHLLVIWVLGLLRMVERTILLLFLLAVRALRWIKRFLSFSHILS